MKNSRTIAPRSRKEWAQRIAFLHTKTVSAIIAVGCERDHDNRCAHVHAI